MRTPPAVLLRSATCCALLVALSHPTALGQEVLRGSARSTTSGQQECFIAIGDVNGDGVSDHLVGLPRAAAQQGLARLLSGADGTILASLAGESGGVQFGWSVANLGDVNGDGVPDFAVGAPAGSLPAQDGSVFIHSGADAALLQRIDGSEPGAGFGFGLIGLGDIDGDGLADLLISSPNANADRGQVAAFSGSTAALLFSRSGALPGDHYGASISGTVASGDGSPEPIIGVVLSGDGSPEPIIGMTASGDGSPEPIIGLTASGDGSPEPIIGASQAGNSGPGYIDVLSHMDLSLLGTMSVDPASTATTAGSLLTDISGGIAGATGAPLATSSGGSTIPNSTMILSLAQAPALATVTLVVGLGFVLDGTQGTLTPTGDIVVSGLATDSAGSLDYALTLPNGIAPDDVLYYQFWVDDGTAPLGNAISNIAAILCENG